MLEQLVTDNRYRYNEKGIRLMSAFPIPAREAIGRTSKTVEEFSRLGLHALQDRYGHVGVSMQEQKP